MDWSFLYAPLPDESGEGDAPQRSRWRSPTSDPLRVLRSSAAQAALTRVYEDADGLLPRVLPARSMQAGLPRLPLLSAERGALLYQLARMLDARLVVAAGTSRGVAAIWLACALRDSGRRSGDRGLIGLEPVEAEAWAARSLLRTAAVARYVDVRESTAATHFGSGSNSIEEPLDLLYIDRHLCPSLGAPMALINRLMPRLRSGGAVIVDRIRKWPDCAEALRDPASGVTAITLPFSAGIELLVKH